MNRHSLASLFLAAVSAAAAAASAADDVLDMGTVLVEGTGLSKYRAGTVSSATGFEAAPEKLPVSVDVLTSDLIRELDAADIHDLLFYQPGVDGGGKSIVDRTAGQYTIRGRAGSSLFLDGALELPGAFGLYLDPNALERIEIVKGPVGALQGGQGSSLGAYGTGGSINVMQKTPDPARDGTDAEVKVSGGERTYRARVTADANYAVTDAITLRLPVSVEAGKPYYASSRSDLARTYMLAPSLLFSPAERFRVLIATTYQHSDVPGCQGLPTWHGKPLAPYTWHSYIPGGNDVRDEYDAYSISGSAEFDATEALQFQAGGALASSHIDYDHIACNTFYQQMGRNAFVPYPGLVNPMGPYVQNSGDAHAKNYGAFARALATWEVGEITNQTLFQGDFIRKETRSWNSGGAGGGAIADPSQWDRAWKSRVRKTSSTVDRWGALAEHNAAWGPLDVLAGIRYDRHESAAGHHADGLSPRTGLSLEALPGVVLFGNWARTEAPNFGLYEYEYSPAAGAWVATDKELTSSWNADQWEGGIRVNPISTLWLSVSYYFIKQNDRPVWDERTGWYEEDNEDDGIEASLSGNVTTNWSFYLGYAWNHDRESHVDTTPPHTATMQTMYKVSGGALDGLGLGGGVRYTDKYDATMRGMLVDRKNLWYDDALVVDLFAEAPFAWFGGSEDWTVRFGVKNVTDEKYFSSTRHYYQAYAADPRTFELSLRGSF
ncbi:MAG: TonB-dependent receptor [Kiritimatiellae bacterium]|nr:TonB-dependent receptor [Kiritimatiellia bacterium]